MRQGPDDCSGDEFCVLLNQGDLLLMLYHLLRIIHYSSLLIITHLLLYGANQNGVTFSIGSGKFFDLRLFSLFGTFLGFEYSAIKTGDYRILLGIGEVMVGWLPYCLYRNPGRYPAVPLSHL